MNHTVPYGTALWGGAVPGTSCQATIAPSLRDISQQTLANPIFEDWSVPAGSHSALGLSQGILSAMDEDMEKPCKMLPAHNRRWLDSLISSGREVVDSSLLLSNPAL